MGRFRKSDFHLPPRVYRRRGKLYHVATDGKWTQLDPSLDAASDQAKHLHLVRSTPDGKGFADLRNCFERIRRNARHREISFDLTWDDVVQMWQRSKGRCEVSGIAFSFLRKTGQKNRPFAPSIDRIDNDAGYSIGNCRLVCVAVNLAINEWGLETFLKVVAGTHKMRRILDSPKKETYPQETGVA